MTITSIDRHVDQLFDVIHRLAEALDKAGIEYRVVGGVAVYFHVQERDPLRARLTRDVDVAIRRADLDGIADAVRPYGFALRHAASADMLVDASRPAARSAVHLVFAGEKVRPDYLQPAPDFTAPATTSEGVLLAPVRDLLRMKLTSFRLKDQVHVQDMDSVGLITAAMEAELPELLRERLRRIRASE